MTSMTATSSGSSRPLPIPASRAATAGATLTNGQRAGADAWIAGTYDPKLRLTYWGTGQAKSGKNGIGDKLFSNATIALDVDTGALKWYEQPAPDEGLDLDEVYEKVLVNEGSQKASAYRRQEGHPMEA